MTRNFEILACFMSFYYLSNLLFFERISLYDVRETIIYKNHLIQKSQRPMRMAVGFHGSKNRKWFSRVPFLEKNYSLWPANLNKKGAR